MGKLLMQEVEAEKNESSFEMFFKANYGRVFAILYRLTGSNHEAEDVAVEIFQRAWGREVHTHENGAAWLYRVALRRGLNSLRAQKRRSTREDASGLTVLGSQDTNPQHVLEQKETRRAVRAALRKMRGRDAGMLLLHHSGFSYREIADALGLNSTSIGTMLARAEREFQKIYNGEKQ